MIAVGTLSCLGARGRTTEGAQPASGVQRAEHVAKLVPATATSTEPYFARRKLLPAFRAAKLSGGADATTAISTERDEQWSWLPARG